MDPVHHSRGRILFEVLCAITVSASCVGAWVQTGASALLWAASAALLYGLVNLFDVARPRSAAIAHPPAMDFPVEQEAGLVAEGADVPPAAADPELMLEDRIEEAQAVERAVRRSGKGRKARAPRKPRAVRPAEEPEAMDVARPEDTDVAASLPSEQAEVSEVEPPDAAEIAQSPSLAQISGIPTPDEASHIPVVPLFEPEPFVRQQRRAFGRKAG